MGWMWVFEGLVQLVVDVKPQKAPLAGGCLVSVTSSVERLFGNGADITNVTLDGKSVLPLVAQGTDFGAVPRGWGAVTNVLSITNNGTGELTISGVTTSGAGAAYFRVTGIPATLAVGASAQVPVSFNPAVAGAHTACVSIANDSLTTPYVVNLAGTTEPGRIGTRVASGVSTVGVASAVTSAGQPSPIEDEYNYYHQQHVYTAVQLAAAGLTNVQITAMGFDVAQVRDPYVLSNYVVRLKETVRTGWTGGDKIMESSGLALVYSNAAVLFTVGNAANMILDSRFVLGANTPLLVDCGYARRTRGGWMGGSIIRMLPTASFCFSGTQPMLFRSSTIRPTP